MRPKVSMVMPCYNKVDFVGEMLNSILWQQWDNIELIIVNDGSTDGSYEVVLDYVPKIKAKGYACVLINQPNAGCCAALKNGLAAATGEYICVVDSDDELDPYYVYLMADFLERNKDFDYAVCDRIEYTGRGSEKLFTAFVPRAFGDMDARMAELYMAGLINPMSWVYMVRAAYFKKCNIVASFVTDTHGSYEPCYNLPLLANNGKAKYFPLPLYHFQVGICGHSRFTAFSQAKAFQDEYWVLCKQAINALSDAAADEHRKRHLTLLACFYRLLGLMNYARMVPDGAPYEQKYGKKLLEYASKWLGLQDYYAGDLDKFRAKLETVKRMVLSKRQYGANSGDRIIGLAAKARKAIEIIPRLINTPFEPVELWDANADSEVLYGIPLKKPDFNSLRGHETILLLTVNREAVREITERLKAQGVHSIIPANCLCAW